MFQTWVQKNQKKKKKFFEGFKSLSFVSVAMLPVFSIEREMAMEREQQRSFKKKERTLYQMSAPSNINTRRTSSFHQHHVTSEAILFNNVTQHASNRRRSSFPTTSCNNRSYTFQQHHPTCSKRGGEGGFPPQVSKRKKEHWIKCQHNPTSTPEEQVLSINIM